MLVVSSEGSSLVRFCSLVFVYLPQLNLLPSMQLPLSVALMQLATRKFLRKIRHHDGPVPIRDGTTLGVGQLGCKKAFHNVSLSLYPSRGEFQSLFANCDGYGDCVML